MKKVLFLCNTPFQLITALNIFLLKHQKDEVSIVLTDYFNGSYERAKKLKKLHLFKKVYHSETIELVRNGKRNIIDGIFNPWKIQSKFDVLDNYEFDLMYFNNFDLLSEVVYSKIKENNEKLVPCRYEEGYSSYFNNYNQQKSCRVYEVLELLRGRYSLKRDTKTFWYYVPEFAKYKHTSNHLLLEIPMIKKTNISLKKIINYVFDVNAKIDSFDTRFIFFEDAFSYNGEKINDLEILKTISKIIGDENLSIKLHPRSNKNRFSNYEFLVNKNLGIPWEVYQLNFDFAGKVFITVASGSVLASKVYFDDDVKIIYLFKCVNHRPKIITFEFMQYLEKVIDKFGGNNIYIPQNVVELSIIIKDIMRETR